MPRFEATRFETTRWSLVRAAGGDEGSAADRALAALCEAYWYPLYAYVRSQGYGGDDARDLTQSFFVLLLERDDVRDLRPERGRFRAFLLASLRHFLQNELAYRRRLKRGGGQAPFSLDFAMAEDRYTQEPADPMTPETIFDRRWALTMLDRVFHRVRQEWEAANKSQEFELLKECLTGEPPAAGYRALAAALGSTEGAIKVAAYRLRRRFRRRFREAIAETVANEAVDEEIRHLVKALGG